MGYGKGIHDEDLRQQCQDPGKLRIVGLLSSVEPEVFQEHYFPRRHAFHRLLYPRSNAVIEDDHRGA